MSRAVCLSCGEPLRGACPTCGRRVLLEGGKIRAHDTGTVHGGHMTWGACPGSGKPPAADVAVSGGMCETCGSIGELCPGGQCRKCHAPTSKEEPLTFEACCAHPGWDPERRRMSAMTRPRLRVVRR